LCAVVNGALAQGDYIAKDYSIADIAIFSWMRSYKNSGGNIDTFQHLAKWLDRVEARPAVQRGLAILSEKSGTLDHSDEVRDILFGKSQINQGLIQ